MKGSLTHFLSLTQLSGDYFSGKSNAPGQKPAHAGQKDSSFSFSDLLDIVNPLHHIPVVSTFYRALTEDSLSPFSRIAGGGLFFNIPGVVLGVVNTAVKAVTGQDIGEHAMAVITGAPEDKVSSHPHRMHVNHDVLPNDDDGYGGGAVYRKEAHELPGDVFEHLDQISIARKYGTTSTLAQDTLPKNRYLSIEV